MIETVNELRNELGKLPYSTSVQVRLSEITVEAIRMGAGPLLCVHSISPDICSHCGESIVCINVVAIEETE